MSIRLGSEILAGTSSNDNLSITKNSYNKLQAVGLIDQNDITKAIRTWTGTREEYEELLENDEIDANTIYNITDDSNPFQDILEAMWPVGSLYIGVMDVCPMSALIGTWELVSSGKVLQGADENHLPGTTIEAGLPNITGHLGTNRVGDTAGSGNQGTEYNSGGNTGALKNTLNFSGGLNLGTTSRENGYLLSGVDFDASQSNSIYGNSNTVQPPAFVVNIWKRVE